MEIGNKILELRKKQNMTQEQLAEKLKVSRQTISKWELGETSPDLNQSKELSKIFNISLDDLTNNDLKNLIVEKISNTEKLTKTIINILKIILLAIIILIIVLVSIIYFREYFDVKPVAIMQSIDCTLEGKDYTYEVWENNETSYMIDKIVINDKKLNIDTTQYTNFEDIFKDIENDVVSSGGTCQ